MSQPKRAAPRGRFSPKALDEESGFRLQPLALAEARRAWHAEDEREQELARFERPGSAFDAEAEMEARPFPLRRRPVRRDAKVAALPDDDPITLPLEWWASARQALIRVLGGVLFAGCAAGLIAVVSTPAAAEAVTTWLSMGHPDELRGLLRDLRHR